MDFQLRPAADADRPFLWSLYCATMRPLIERTWGWDDAWQQADFNTRLSNSVVSVIETAGRPAGRLSLEWKPDALYVQELQLMPECQSKGIGTAVMGHVIEMATSRRLPVVLSVLSANPRAQRLYERLGFRVTDEKLPFIQMRRDA